MIRARTDWYHCCDAATAQVKSKFIHGAKRATASGAAMSAIGDRTFEQIRTETAKRLREQEAANQARRGCHGGVTLS